MRALGDVACQWEAGLQRGLWPLPLPRRVQGIRVPGSLTLPLEGLSGSWDLLLALGALTPAQRWTEVGLSSPWRPRRPMVSHQPELQHRLPSGIRKRDSRPRPGGHAVSWGCLSGCCRLQLTVITSTVRLRGPGVHKAASPEAAPPARAPPAPYARRGVPPPGLVPVLLEPSP